MAGSQTKEKIQNKNLSMVATPLLQNREEEKIKSK